MNAIQRSSDDIVTFLIPIGMKEMPTGDPAPYVAIVTKKWGESFKSAARLAIYVYVSKGAYEFVNGVFAAEIEPVAIPMDVGWPQLEKELGKKPKAWSHLFNAKSGYKPHTAVKNIFLGDVSDTLGEPEYGPAEALVVLGSWNNWESKNLNSAARRGKLLEYTVDEGDSKVEEVTNVNVLAASTNRFDKFCSELGLKRGVKVPIEHWSQLRQAIDQAVDINRIVLSRL